MDVFEGTLQHALLTGESQPHEQQTIDCIRSFFHVAQISQSTGSCRVPRASGLQYHIIDARADTDGCHSNFYKAISVAFDDHGFHILVQTALDN